MSEFDFSQISEKLLKIGHENTNTFGNHGKAGG